MDDISDYISMPGRKTVNIIFFPEVMTCNIASEDKHDKYRGFTTTN